MDSVTPLRIQNRIIVISIVLVIGYLFFQIGSEYFSPRTVPLLVGNRHFAARVATTDRTRQQGLSGTAQLGTDQAMLFVFDSNRKWPIWMKDMHYAIDIVWLDESQKIVDYVTDASPASYPARTFAPKKDARYVVEFVAGTVRRTSMRIGQEIIFDIRQEKL